MKEACGISRAQPMHGKRLDSSPEPGAGLGGNAVAHSFGGGGPWREREHGARMPRHWQAGMPALRRRLRGAGFQPASWAASLPPVPSAGCGDGNTGQGCLPHAGAECDGHFSARQPGRSPKIRSPKICGFAQEISNFHAGRCFPALGRRSKVLRRCPRGFFSGHRHFVTAQGRFPPAKSARRSAKAVGGWHKPDAAVEIRFGTGENDEAQRLGTFFLEILDAIR